MIKYKLIFENSMNERKIIGYVGEELQSNNWPTFKQTFKMINRFLSNYPNFKKYYTRIHGNEENGWCLDVGSWSEFFYLIPTNEEWHPIYKEDNTIDYFNYAIEKFDLKYPDKANKILQEDNNDEEK